MAETVEAFGKSNGVGFNSPAGLALNRTPQPITACHCLVPCLERTR